jgi:hypothetical protein
VDSGVHRVLATLDSGEQGESSVDAKAGQVAQAHLELLARPLPTPAASATPVQPPNSAPVPLPALKAQPEPSVIGTNHSTQKVLAYIVGATGIALGGAAAAHFLWNRSRYEDWQSRYGAYYDDPTPQNRESANTLAQSVSNASAVTVGLAIGAGVALGTSAVLLLTSSGSVTAAGSGTGGPFMTLRGKF